MTNFERRAWFFAFLFLALWCLLFGLFLMFNTYPAILYYPN